MSNLSDLLPAGAGAKAITATASGNLATGQTVALLSDGTVKAIAVDGVSSSLGTAATYISGAGQSVIDNAIAYDSTNNKILVAYKDGSTSKGMAVVGTISGTSISFGTAAEFSGNVTGDQYRRIAVCFNSTEGKFVIAFRDSTINNYGRAVTATISGTSVSFGSSAVFSGTDVTFSPTCAFDSTSNRVVIAYTNDSDGGDGYAVVGTISGTSLSFGTPQEFESGYTHFPVAVYDSNADRTVIVYRDAGNSNYGTAVVGTVNVTSISFGSPVVFESAQTEHQTAAYDSANYKIVIAYSDQGNSGYGTGIVGTVSGTSISFGSAAVFESASTGSVQMQAAYNVEAGKTVIGYGDSGNSTYGTYVEATVSGTSLTFSTPAVFEAATVGRTPAVAAYDSTNKLVVFSYQDDGNASAGTAIAYRSQYSNFADFVGITNQAINNSASGEVVVEGGVITNGSLLPPLTTASYGSEAVYNTGNSRYPAIVYDTVNDKIVIAYADYGDSNKGKAIVGTVSGTSISYGSAVEFNSGSTDYVTAVFDASAGKVVIGYRDVGNSNYGTAIVGTVSGTSISFGTEVVFESAEAMYVEASYDANAQKTLFVYQDNGNSGYLTAQVGTVSGTSISFGGASALNNDSSVYIAIAYDSTANKHVVFFANGDNSNRGDACVVTISGTSMSVGSFTTGVAANALRTAVAYDANANKSVIFFSDADNSNIGKAIIGTVSGTSISVGTAVTWNSTNVAFHGTPAFYDSTTNKVIIGYNDTNDSNKGKTKIGTVDGDTITFGDAVVFNSTSTSGGEIAITKDTDNNKIVIAFKDNGNSNYGTGIVGTLSSSIPNFTIGSTYYVQDDGTLSTTSSSVTAGKAVANTTLMIKG